MYDIGNRNIHLSLDQQFLIYSYTDSFKLAMRIPLIIIIFFDSITTNYYVN